MKYLIIMLLTPVWGFSQAYFQASISDVSVFDQYKSGFTHAYEIGWQEQNGVFVVNYGLSYWRGRLDGEQEQQIQYGAIGVQPRVYIDAGEADFILGCGMFMNAGNGNITSAVLPSVRVNVGARFGRMGVELFFDRSLSEGVFRAGSYMKRGGLAFNILI